MAQWSWRLKFTFFLVLKYLYYPGTWTTQTACRSSKVNGAFGKHPDPLIQQDDTSTDRRVSVGVSNILYGVHIGSCCWWYNKQEGYIEEYFCLSWLIKWGKWVYESDQRNDLSFASGFWLVLGSCICLQGSHPYLKGSLTSSLKSIHFSATK